VERLERIQKDNAGIKNGETKQMKRFIDLRGQIYNDDYLPKDEQEPVFAFYCTSTDTFEQFKSGVQTWESIEDFKEDFTGDITLYNRLMNLIPGWVPEND
jgi:chloramphenicol O-acetyltransferase